MPYYCKRPVVIEAIEITKRIEIKTLEGVMVGEPGDMLITGVRVSSILVSLIFLLKPTTRLKNMYLKATKRGRLKRYRAAPRRKVYQALKAMAFHRLSYADYWLNHMHYFGKCHTKVQKDLWDSIFTPPSRHI